MRKMTTQFHATLEEIVGYANSVKSEFGLAVTLANFRPFALKIVEGDLTVHDLDHGLYINIVFTKLKLVTNAASQIAFYDLNPGMVNLRVGGLTEKGLEESFLTFMSDDDEKIALATKLASRLKKLTKAGVVGCNPITGAEGFNRNHRYTPGAKLLCEAGVKILSLTGSTFYKLAG
ncbi:MAG: hypothetical protein ACK4NV_14410 [Pannonibacter sp.]